jgi:hypothetical protein
LQTTSFAPIRHGRQVNLPSTHLGAAGDGTNLSGPPYWGPTVKPILDTINSPADMKRLDMRQLKQVCDYAIVRLG